jgi:hypothetical protein
MRSCLRVGEVAREGKECRVVVWCILTRDESKPAIRRRDAWAKMDLLLQADQPGHFVWDEWPADGA